MSKIKKLKKEYIVAKRKKEVVDAEFYKALNRYFTHIHGKNLGGAIGYASTLDW